MRKQGKRCLAILLLLGILAGGVTFRQPLLAVSAKAANLSASYFFTNGMIWKARGSKPSAKEPSPLATIPAEQGEEAPFLTPSPPAGVKTGKVQTKTLPLSAANTVTGGVHVSNKTGLSSPIQDLLEKGMPFSLKSTGQPQVLIVHTHATESYLQGDYGYYISSASTRSTDNTKNTVRVGQVLAEVLNKANIVTINDATQHDHPNYNGSYTRSRTTIEQYLEKYPTIQVVIDLHRDAIGGGENIKIKPTTTVNGKKAAQVMILAGAQTGSVENFPNWQENLRFCLQLQRQLETDYGNLARPLLFKACKYNFDVLPGSILVEVGTDANTLEEAEYAAELLGNALVQLLKPI